MNPPPPLPRPDTLPLHFAGIVEVTVRGLFEAEALTRGRRQLLDQVVAELKPVYGEAVTLKAVRQPVTNAVERMIGDRLLKRVWVVIRRPSRQRHRPDRPLFVIERGTGYAVPGLEAACVPPPGSDLLLVKQWQVSNCPRDPKIYVLADGGDPRPAAPKLPEGR